MVLGRKAAQVRLQTFVQQNESFQKNSKQPAGRT